MSNKTTLPTAPISNQGESFYFGTLSMLPKPRRARRNLQKQIKVTFRVKPAPLALKRKTSKRKPDVIAGMDYDTFKKKTAHQKPDPSWFKEDFSGMF